MYNFSHLLTAVFEKQHTIGIKSDLQGIQKLYAMTLLYIYITQCQLFS